MDLTHPDSLILCQKHKDSIYSGFILVRYIYIINITKVLAM